MDLYGHLNIDKIYKMALGVFFALFFLFHGVLLQHDNHFSAIDDTNTHIRISQAKCDEYYRKMMVLLRLPIRPKTTTETVIENSELSTSTPVSTSKLPTYLGTSPVYPWPPPAVVGGQTTRVGEFPHMLPTSTPVSTSKLPTYLGAPPVYPRSPPAVVGGQTTGVGEFPHMAAIGWSNPEGGFTFNCGGVLISPRYILTAAHCTYSFGANDPYPSVVRLGDQNINPAIHDGAQPVEISIKKITKHPQYTRKKQYNDIAILELDTEVNFTHSIQPACLWTNEDLGHYTEAIATGWGVTNSETEEKADELQKVTLSILTNEYCNNSLSSIINRKWEKGFDDTQLCAGEPQAGKDTCQGDSGSPLQVLTEEYPPQYYVIGITSFGPRVCARLPAVYTRVYSYLDWIESVVWISN